MECIFEYSGDYTMTVITIDHSTDIDKNGELSNKHSNDMNDMQTFCSIQVLIFFFSSSRNEKITDIL